MNLKAITSAVCAIAAAITLAIGAGDAAGAAPEVECRKVTCPFELEGGALELRFGRSEIGCRSLDGYGDLRAGSSGLTTLRLRGCRERITPFHFSCTGGAGSGRVVESNAMETSISGARGDTAELRLSNLWLTLLCGGFLRVGIEGFWVGRLRELACGGRAADQPLRVKLLAHGREGTAAAWDVYLDARVDTYRVRSPWRVTFENPKAICLKRA